MNSPCKDYVPYNAFQGIARILWAIIVEGLVACRAITILPN
jgi:hypothetical protein